MADITKEYLALRDQYIESRFARLNPVQRQAVFATEGPLLILAGWSTALPISSASAPPTAAPSCRAP